MKKEWKYVLGVVLVVVVIVALFWIFNADGELTGRVIGTACMDDSQCNTSLRESCIVNGSGAFLCTYNSSLGCQIYLDEMDCLGDSYGFANASLVCVWDSSLCLANITIEPPVDDCVVNWSAIQTNCTTDETYIKYSIDLNHCNDSTGLPENESIGCDYDGNGIIGDAGELGSSGLVIVIDDNEMDQGINYTGTKKVEIKEGNITFIEFDWNFASGLNLRDIQITRHNSDSDQSFIIIQGMDVLKTVYLEPSSDSNRLCIKDEEITSVSDISSNCIDDNETLLDCPGTTGGFTCSFNDSVYVIEGLEHSGILELESQENCSASWDCSNWSDCVSGINTRVCVDVNSCNTTLGMPAESQSCSVDCTPLWTCGNWSDCLSGFQTRGCNDVNSCGVTTNKPIESRACEEEYSDINYKLIFIIIGTILIIGVIVAVIIYFLNKEADDANNGKGVGGLPSNGMPPSQPPKPPRSSTNSVNSIPRSPLPNARPMPMPTQ
jgi:hypothetical protein